MGDEGMDPCECLSHEIAVRRLLSLLRQTQSECTDTQCFEDINEPSTDGSFIVTALILSLALIIFLLRPRSTQNVQKAVGNNQGPLPPPDAPIN